MNLTYKEAAISYANFDPPYSFGKIKYPNLNAQIYFWEN